MLGEHAKYDSLFYNVKPHAIGGIRIFTKNDPCLIEQDYDGVTDEERQIWKRLFERLIKPLDQYASILWKVSTRLSRKIVIFSYLRGNLSR